MIAFPGMIAEAARKAGMTVPDDEPCERMPGRTPWTVSIAVYPEDSPCPALEALDLMLKKDRQLDPIWDPLLEAWVDKIEWPKPVYRPPVFLPIVADLIRQRLWADWEDWLYRAMPSFQVPAEFLDEKAK